MLVKNINNLYSWLKMKRDVFLESSNKARVNISNSCILGSVGLGLMIFIWSIRSHSLVLICKT